MGAHIISTVLSFMIIQFRNCVKLRAALVTLKCSNFEMVEHVQRQVFRLNGAVCTEIASERQSIFMDLIVFF